MSEAGKVWAYQIAREADGVRTSLRLLFSKGGEEVFVLFSSRRQAEAYCFSSGLPQPWPIDTLTLLEAKALLWER